MLLKNRRTPNRKKGFTLSETLMVVAIIIGLMALATGVVISIQRSIRQRKMDDCAQQVYMIAQQQLSGMKYSGRMDEILAKSTGNKLEDTPSDASSDVIDKINNGMIELHYFTSEDADTTLADLLLPQSCIDGELRSGHWVVEYDLLSQNVYAAYYSEKEVFSDYYDNVNKKYNEKYQKLRDKADGSSNSGIRKSETQGNIGYYGGTALTGNEDKEMDVSVSVINAEQLSLFVSYIEPSVKQADNTTVSDTVKTVSFVITDTDTNNSTTLSYTVGSNKSKFNNVGKATPLADLTEDTSTGRKYTSIILDSIEDATNKYSFKTITGMNTGDNISITVKVETETGIIGTSSVKTNSGFADKVADDSTKETVSVAYGRHLQNLANYSSAKDVYVTQTKDIDFTDDNTEANSWYALYGQKGINFIPIINDKVKSYDGQTYSITGMTINQYNTIANDAVGMFGTFAGSELKNICMIDPSIDVEGVDTLLAEAKTGVIAGQTNALTAMENCSVYLSEEYANKISKDTSTSQPIKNLGDVYKVVRGKKYTGGLIGYVQGSQDLTITQCFAALSLAGNQYASGLIGFANSTGTISIFESYADCYLFAKNTAGLVCIENGTNQQKLNVKNCYTAGFAYARGDSAGIVYAAKDGTTPVGADTKNDNMVISYSYSILAIKPDTADSINCFNISNIKRDSLTTAVYYLGIAEDPTKQGQQQQDMESTTFLGKLNEEGQARFSFVNTTHTYNLMDNGLQDYTFPVLNTIGTTGKEHYGDWEARFNKGLVYYEKYSDDTYGFYGANASLLQPNKTVVADGYAYVMNKEDYSSSIPVNVIFSAASTVKAEDSTPVGGGSTPITVHDNKMNVDYVLIPIDKVIDNKINGAQPITDSFYYQIQIDTDIFYFNPYFARTVRTVAGNSTKAPSTPSNVYISTPRHLNNLSRYPNYWNFDGVSYVQDRDIDYSLYKGYSEVINGANTSGYTYKSIIDSSLYSLTNGNLAIQSPIGTMDRPFTRNYDGGEKRISGVSFAINASKGANSAVGLFGYATSLIKDITLGDTQKTNYYGISNENIQGSRTNVYMGAVCAYNGGTVRNCAVTNYLPAVNLTSSSKNTRIKTYNNSILYIGGFVGINEGTISKASADISEIKVDSTSAYVYGGSFAGYNKGLIQIAYGFSNINGRLDTNLVAYYGGFAGYNLGRIQNAYCAASITVGGRAKKYGFTYNNGNVSDGYYLTNVDGTYYNKVYAYSADTSSDTNGISRVESFDALRALSASGFASNAVAIVNNMKENNNPIATFPYPAVITRGGSAVSIGNWPEDARLGSVGIVYWEHEEGGTNEGYYFSTVDSDGNKASTLCTEHNDGGQVTEYGYGYYYQNDASATWELELSQYVNMKDATPNTGVAGILQAAMPQYTFVVYTTGEGEKQLHLCGNYSGYEDVTTTSDVTEALTKAEYDAITSDTSLVSDGSTETKTQGNVTYYKTTEKPSGDKYTSSKETEYEAIGATLDYSSNNVLQYAIATYSKWGGYKTTSYKDIKISFKATSGYLDDSVKYLESNVGNSNNNFVLEKSDSSAYDVKIAYNVQNGNSYDTYWQFGYKERDDFYRQSNLTYNSYNYTFSNNTFSNNTQWTYSDWWTTYYYGYKKKNANPVEMKYTVTTRQVDTIYYYYKVTTIETVTQQPTGTVVYAPNGIVTLKSTVADAATPITHSFVLNPFFADSMMVADSTKTDAKNISSLGTAEGQKYSVRSLSQLQFINWNAKTSKATEDFESYNTVQSNVLDKYTYHIYLLRYNQNKTVVHLSENMDSLEGEFYWNQSHDLGNSTNVVDFHPIGGIIDYDIATEAGSTGTANAVVAAFGGTYNGQDYRIQNIKISSSAQCVGLFGSVMSGKLEHIVMSATNTDAVIEANYKGNNWYCIGGLVGFAAKGNKTGKTTDISNCSSSGYVVKDARAKHGYGGAGVGGLLGINNMNLSNCSAVNKIVLEYTYDDSSRNIRVGGIAGTSRGSISNCYAGGEIGNNPSNNDTGVYVAGIAGGTFIKNSGNLNGLVGSSDAKSELYNCYTYVKLPTNVKKAVSIFSNGADGSGSTTIKNCYYLNESGYINKASRNNTIYMHDGKTSNSCDTVSTGLSFVQMSKEKGGLCSYLVNRSDATHKGNWGFVSKMEGDVLVNGKYSFNSSSAWSGKNYPFPTILQQESDGKTYNVHYGDWPANGILVKDTEDNTIKIGLLKNSESSVTKEVTITAESGGTFIVKSSETSIATVSSKQLSNGNYQIEITGMGVGVATITLQYTVNGYTYEAYITVIVTADISIEAPDAFTVYAGNTDVKLLSGWTPTWNEPLEMRAVNGAGEQLAGGTWKVTTQDTDITIGSEDTNNPTITTERFPGSTSASVKVEYTYTLNDKSYNAVKIIPITIVEPREKILENYNLYVGSIDNIVALNMDAKNISGCTWTTEVFEDEDYTQEASENFIEATVNDDATVSLRCIGGNVTNEKQLYVRLYGVKNGNRSVCIKIPVTLVQPYVVSLKAQTIKIGESVNNISLSDLDLPDLDGYNWITNVYNTSDYTGDVTQNITAQINKTDTQTDYSLSLTADEESLSGKVYVQICGTKDSAIPVYIRLEVILENAKTTDTETTDTETVGASLLSINWIIGRKGWF